ncbi:MAG TPA: CRISPR-associated endonuclease Cas1 [Acidobacteriota bacterium]|nr:CRISPR-associated endonuclease Cas1 [Acidobacteriota bacterium]
MGTSSGSQTSLPDFLPVRMLNEFTYCPRLAYLEWVQGEFADNAYTLEGTFEHRRVDVGQGELPYSDDANQGESGAEDEETPAIVRSLNLSSPRAGLITKIDLVEVKGNHVVPIDYKRGHKPSVPEGAYEPERVQLCAQAIILRDNGYQCDHGEIYFAGSKRRVTITFDERLVARTLELADEMRRVAAAGTIPPPLGNSPKCEGCSLVAICLPDETGMLRAGIAETEPETVRTEPRRLIPARDDALPVYVQTQGAYISRSADVLVIKHRQEKIAEARLFETSQLNILGNVQISTQSMQELCRRGIPVAFFSTGGWFWGLLSANLHKNVEQRLNQFRTAESRERSLALARAFISSKIRNCRTLIRRNAAGVEESDLRRLRDLARAASEAASLESLLGIEGTAARLYFQLFPKMIKRQGVAGSFDFGGRNRRPPRDPVNSLLSLAYSLLVKDLTIMIAGAGFDPFLGFYHQPRYGRPSLALDLMEEFRPLIADSTVISALNTNVIDEDDFIRSSGAVALTTPARRSFIQAYERRMDQLIRHPVFGYQISYRRVLDVQVRLLGRYLAGEIPEYPKFITR